MGSQNLVRRPAVNRKQCGFETHPISLCPRGLTGRASDYESEDIEVRVLSRVFLQRGGKRAVQRPLLRSSSADRRQGRTRLRRAADLRVSPNGRASDFQSDDVGSNPIARSCGDGPARSGRGVANAKARVRIPPLPLSRPGGIGRRTGLKIRHRRVCEFEARGRHLPVWRN